jgi:AcrR family transcriptional regulator
MSQTNERKSRMSAEARREQLIDAATTVVLDRGFHYVSIDAVAKESGITRAVVYQHFRDLSELLDAVFDRAVERALKQVKQGEMPPLRPEIARDRLIESASMYSGAVRSNPDVWRLVLMTPEGAPESLRDKVNRGREQVLEQMTSAMRPVLAESTDAELTASVLSAVADHYARLTLNDPDRFPPDRVLAHADWVIQGFLQDIE